MKTSLLISIYFCFMSVLLVGQPTITSAYFPEAGDILKYRITASPASSITPQGTGMQSWDFSALPLGIATLRDTFLDASEGIFFNDFLDADLMQQVGLSELYYNVTTDKVELIGYAGLDPVGIGLNISTRYDEPALYRTAPLELFSQVNFTSSVSFAADADDIPDTLLSQIPNSSFIDSVRVSIVSDISGVADAHGMMAISGDNYEVLRLNLTENRETLVFAKALNIWLDITNNVSAFLPDEVGEKIFRYYDFYSNDKKETIAQLNVNPDTDEVETVRYIASGPVSIPDMAEDVRPWISAYPNPVVHNVQFKLFDIPSGKYTIKLFNILGTVVWAKDYQVSQNTSFNEDLSSLSRGTYLYSLVDERGKTLVTRRLAIIRP